VPATIPKCIAFLDVETTGLNEKDRIVTLAGLKLLDTNFLRPAQRHWHICISFSIGQEKPP
jgi:hypothetical protein